MKQEHFFCNIPRRMQLKCENLKKKTFGFLIHIEKK